MPTRSSSDILLQVRATPPANGLHAGQTVIGFADPLGAPQAIRDVAATGVSMLSMELMPRITRAQSMDALSSMATVAGYKGVLLAANQLPRMFPMLMTAAGTVSPARVFIVGAGVAGLQAISAARRLGAKVEAYDVRPAVKEQVQSLGARFVELPLESADSEDKGGYAKAQDESFYRRQREMMIKVVAASDVVITTALIPGKRAPILITTEMVEAMQPGSVVVDLAAERGGNCELTRPDEVVRPQGRHHHRPVESAGAGAVPREPDVLEEHHHVPAAPARERRREAVVARPQSRRRDHARDAADAGTAPSFTPASRSCSAEAGQTRMTMWVINTEEQVESPFTFRILPGSHQDHRARAARGLHRRCGARLARPLPADRRRRRARSRRSREHERHVRERRPRGAGAAQDRRPAGRREGGVRGVEVVSGRSTHCHHHDDTKSRDHEISDLLIS